MADEVDASKLTDADAKAVDVSTLEPIMINLALDGKTSAYSVGDLTEIAATAKSKVKRSARGWSMLSQIEILALAWLADLLLVDADLTNNSQPKAAPAVISNL